MQRPGTTSQATILKKDKVTLRFNNNSSIQSLNNSSIKVNMGARTFLSGKKSVAPYADKL